MKDKKIVWICPGNMSKDCEGKVGDVVLSSAVTKYLSEKGATVHFITNGIMVECIQNSYEDMTVSKLEGTSGELYLGSNDIVAAAKADKIFILRPSGDQEGDEWKQQLTTNGVDPQSIHRVGCLDAFSTEEDQHMVNQILKGIREQPINSPEDMPFPLFKPDPTPTVYRTYINYIGDPDYLILPFAGKPEKWLPKETLVGMAERLSGSGSVLVVGEDYDRENHSEEWSKYRELLLEKKVPLLSMSKEEIPVWAVGCKEIYSVDGGLCWVTIAGLNLLAIENGWGENRYPKIKVIIGRKPDNRLNPTASVWRPLVKFPSRVEHVNKDQDKRLMDVGVDEIIPRLQVATRSL